MTFAPSSPCEKPACLPPTTTSFGSLNHYIAGGDRISASLHDVLCRSCRIFPGKRILNRSRVGSRRTSLSASKWRCTGCGSSAHCTVVPRLRIASEKESPSVSRRPDGSSAGSRPSFCKASYLYRWRHFWKHGSLFWTWRLGPSGPNFFRTKVSDCFFDSFRMVNLDGQRRI